MDTTGKRFIVGNLINDDSDASDKQIRCENETSVQVAKSDQNYGENEAWTIHTKPPYDPENPGVVPTKIWFESQKYSSTTRHYLGCNSNIANLQTSITYFVPTPIEGEDGCYLLSLFEDSRSYLTMEDPSDSKEIEFKNLPLEGSKPAPKPKHKWKFDKIVTF